MKYHDDRHINRVPIVLRVYDLEQNETRMRNEMMALQLKIIRLDVRCMEMARRIN